MGRSVDYANNAEFVLFMPFEYEDEFDAQWEWENFKEDLEYFLPSLFPSLEKCDKWEGNECHGFLENAFGRFYLSEYCGLVSLSFALRESAYGNDWYGDPDISGLGAAWAEKAEAKLRKAYGSALYNKVGTFSNGEAVYERAAA